MEVDIGDLVNTAKTAYSIGKVGYGLYKSHRRKQNLPNKVNNMSLRGPKKRKLNRGTAAVNKTITDNYIRSVARQAIDKGTETRYKKTHWASVAITNASLNDTLTDIAEGTAFDERTGRKIRLTGLYGNILINGATGTDVDDFVRIVIYSFIGSESTPLSTTITSIIDNRRYNVIIDKIVYLPHGNDTGTGITKRRISLRKSFKKGGSLGRRVTYTGAAATDYQNGEIFICTTGLVNQAKSITYEWNTYFKDES